jgi:CBS-domain-containing membrane protein
MARDVRTCTPEDDVRDVHATMREHQIRRLPVVDEGRRLIGLVSINDLATEAFAGRSAAASKRQRDVAKTIAEISRRRADNGGASM